MTRPVLELYEDVHWVDPSTLELLDLLIERVRTLRVLVIITFRPEFSPPWSGHAHVTSLPLNRLGRRQGAAIVDQLTGGKSLPGEILEQIVAKTDGVPLFVEELTKTVLESGLLRDAGDRYELAGPLPPLAIPASLHDSLMARLDRLAPVKEVAQIGAVIGREFSYELLATVADMPTSELGRRSTNSSTPSSSSAMAARQSHLQLQARAGAGRGLSVAAQIQTAAAACADRGRHSAAPAGSGRAAARSGRSSPKRSRHACGGGRRLAQGRGAGRAQLGASRGHGACQQGRRVAQTIAETREWAEQELALQLIRRRFSIVTAGYAASIAGQAYGRAAELTAQIGDRKQQFRVLDGYWTYHAVEGNVGRAYEVAQEMAALAAEIDSTDHHVFACQAMGVSSLLLGEFRRARDYLARRSMPALG